MFISSEADLHALSVLLRHTYLRLLVRVYKVCVICDDFLVFTHHIQSVYTRSNLIYGMREIIQVNR